MKTTSWLFRSFVSFSIFRCMVFSLSHIMFMFAYFRMYVFVCEKSWNHLYKHIPTPTVYHKYMYPYLFMCTRSHISHQNVRLSKRLSFAYISLLLCDSGIYDGKTTTYIYYICIYMYKWMNCLQKGRQSWKSRETEMPEHQEQQE